MPFTCAICEETSTQICVRCTKDTCGNHLCPKCNCCSDCCACEVQLDRVPEAAPLRHAEVAGERLERALPAVPFRATIPLREHRAAGVLNALTIDVEDYYHVSGFERLIHRDQWPTFESRVVASTHKILRVLDRASVRATFFVLGWVADKHPELVRTIRAAGHACAALP